MQVAMRSNTEILGCDAARCVNACSPFLDWIEPSRLILFGLKMLHHKMLNNIYYKNGDSDIVLN